MAVSQVELCNLALSRSGGHRITQITSLGEASNEARQCAVKLPHLIRTALRSFPWRFATKKIALARIVYSKYNDINDPYESALASYSLPSDYKGSDKNYLDSVSKNSDNVQIPTQIDDLTQNTFQEKFQNCFKGSPESLSDLENSVTSSTSTNSTATTVTKNLSETEKTRSILYGSNILYQYPEDCLNARFIYSARDKSSYNTNMNDENSGHEFNVELGDDGTKVILTNIEDAVLLYTSEANDPTIWDPLFYDALAWQLAAELCVSLGNDMQKAQSLESKAGLAWDKAKSLDGKESASAPFVSSYLLARR